MPPAKPVELRQLEWPDFGQPSAEPVPSAAGLQRRLERLRDRMRAAGFSHLLVYGDKEHSANLKWLTHFDPRFEEALLILGESQTPLILVGNECEAYLRISPLLADGSLRMERFAAFSLPDQPPADSRDLTDVLRAEGVCRTSMVGCAGWKAYANPAHLDLPAYLADAVRLVAGAHQVANAMGLFTDPASGLRARCGAEEIAYFEYSNAKASEAMRRVLHAVRPGLTDFQALEAARYDGTPLSCHMTCKTGAKRISLASPRGDVVESGNPWSANIGYWGSNICRAGWVAESAADLPESARGYVEEFAAPYFAAMAEWLEGLRIGTSAGDLYDGVHRALPFDRFHIVLNPGHLIHYEEWLSSPFYAGSAVPLASGMVIQSDVIPSSPTWFSSRMEDGYALADDALRGELGNRFPDVLQRCEMRRAFLREELGIAVGEELLPLSNCCGIVAPFVLAPQQVFTRRAG